MNSKIAISQFGNTNTQTLLQLEIRLLIRPRMKLWLGELDDDCDDATMIYESSSSRSSFHVTSRTPYFIRKRSPRHGHYFVKRLPKFRIRNHVVPPFDSPRCRSWRHVTLDDRICGSRAVDGRRLPEIHDSCLRLWQEEAKRRFEFHWDSGFDSGWNGRHQPPKRRNYEHGTIHDDRLQFGHFSAHFVSLLGGLLLGLERMLYLRIWWLISREWKIGLPV